MSNAVDEHWTPFFLWLCRHCLGTLAVARLPRTKEFTTIRLERATLNSHHHPCFPARLQQRRTLVHSASVRISRRLLPGGLKRIDEADTHIQMHEENAFPYFISSSLSFAEVEIQDEALLFGCLTAFPERTLHQNWRLRARSVAFVAVAAVVAVGLPLQICAIELAARVRGHYSCFALHHHIEHEFGKLELGFRSFTFYGNPKSRKSNQKVTAPMFYATIWESCAPALKSHRH
ncbi:hypothetical protein EX30DRAFT_387704 [Ascodesmis nigricans]|uniref:Uncharacterized protein n=1 Tax=Ascodesmis nigricans TaxID=341454 RepID=A0A4S2MK71_9PEZI|nr:hypothetical protein EX30DRAFT_387704 [Ascodesmis nigricans]